MKDFVTILFRRKWHAITFFAFMVIVPMTFAYVLPKKYEAKAALILTPGREKKPFIPSERDTRTSYMQVSMEDVGSEVELMLSYPVISAAVDKNGLDQDIPPSSDEMGKYIAYKTQKMINAVLIGVGLKTDIPPREDAIKRLSKQLNVEFIKRTNIISVKWRGSTPELAKDVVNTVVDAHLAHHVKVYGNTQAFDTIKSQMDSSYRKLVNMEDKLAAYSSKESISDVNKEHEEIITKLAEAESKFKILQNLSRKEVATAELGNISGDPAFLELSNKLTDAELKKIELMSRFGSEDRKILAVNKEIEELKGLIKRRLSHSLLTWKELADSYRKQLRQLDRARISISRIKRDIEDLNQQYLLNKEKFNEIFVSKIMDQASLSSVKVVEYAIASNTPASPKKIIILIVSLFFGVVGGIAYAFSFDKLSGRIMSLQDIEKFAGIPVLSSIRQYTRKQFENSGALAGSISKELISLTEQLSKNGKDLAKTVLVVSPSNGAGTSFVTESIVRLVSKDVKNNVICITFCHRDELRANRANLKQIFSSMPSIAEFIIRKKDEGFDRLNIDVLHDDLDMLENKTKDLLEKLKEKYRYVLVDVPVQRTGMFYLKFVPYVDDILIVAAYNITCKHPLLRMTEIIERNKGKITGCIFNRRQNVIPDFIYNRLF